MKFLGKISHISNSGRLIVRASETPPSGAFILNENREKIGKIAVIFGPTKNPYISINILKSIDLKDFENSCGENLYVSPNKKNKRRRRKRKKR